MNPIKKNMLLTFKSNMKNLEEEKDQIEFVTRAELVKQNDKYYVTFCDTEALGNETPSKTTLKIENEKVRYCEECGTKLVGKVNQCTNCGKKVVD